MTQNETISVFCDLGVGDGQGGLVCCNSWGRKELDMTEPLNWTDLNVSNVKETSLKILRY